jgi:hypothetical protein
LHKPNLKAFIKKRIDGGLFFRKGDNNVKQHVLSFVLVLKYFLLLFNVFFLLVHQNHCNKQLVM